MAQSGFHPCEPSVVRSLGLPRQGAQRPHVFFVVSLVSLSSSQFRGLAPLDRGPLLLGGPKVRGDIPLTRARTAHLWGGPPSGSGVVNLAGLVDSYFRCFAAANSVRPRTFSARRLFQKCFLGLHLPIPICFGCGGKADSWLLCVRGRTSTPFPRAAAGGAHGDAT